MRIKGWAGLAALALVGVMASTAVAQPGGGNRGGRGGGFGGFGMGGFGTQSSVQLAGIEAVQKDLGVSDDQIAKIKTLSEEASTERREAFAGGGGGGGGGGFQNLSDEERAARAKKMTEINDKYKAKLKDVLNATQSTRLDEIQLQAAGSQAYSDPAVVAKLNISKDQQEKIAAINKDYGDKMREMFPRPGAGGGGGGGGNAADFQERMTKMREMNQARDKELAAVLTDDQSSQFAKMKGKEFDVAQLRQGFGGPGGGGRPGGGAGGGGGNRPNRPQ